MKLPFDAEDCFTVSGACSEVVWPAQVVSSGAALGFGRYEDAALLVSALFAAVMLLPLRSPLRLPA